jgi:Spy/CpxP family protein refolding chaperone
MKKILSAASVFLMVILIFTGCNTESPQQTDFDQSFKQMPLEDQAETLYMLGNDDPIAAETASDFVVFGPKPFLLWALDLTDEQKEQIREIGQKYRPEMRSMCGGYKDKSDWEAKKEERQALRVQMLEEIKTILTEDQLILLAEMEAQIEAGEYPTIIIEKRVAFLADTLGLSQEQQDQIRDIMAEYGAQIIQLRHEGSDPKTTHNEIHTLMQAYDTDIKSLLTEEQLEIYEGLKQGFREGKKWNWRGKGPHGRGHK